MNEFTIELEARPAGADMDWRPSEADVTFLLGELEQEGSFRGPVLSVAPNGNVKVLGQIRADTIDGAMTAGRYVYAAAFRLVFDTPMWTILAATEFPATTVGTIPTPV